jgi:hypothetical protein
MGPPPVRRSFSRVRRERLQRSAAWLVVRRLLIGHLGRRRQAAQGRREGKRMAGGSSGGLDSVAGISGVRGSLLDRRSGPDRAVGAVRWAGAGAGPNRRRRRASQSRRGADTLSRRFLVYDRKGKVKSISLHFSVEPRARVRLTQVAAASAAVCWNDSLRHLAIVYDPIGII